MKAEWLFLCLTPSLAEFEMSSYAMRNLERRLLALESFAPPGDRQAADALLRSLTEDELERLEAIAATTGGDPSRLTTADRSWLTAITEATP